LKDVPVRRPNDVSKETMTKEAVMKQ
jgi:hypothetical protein